MLQRVCGPIRLLLLSILCGAAVPFIAGLVGGGGFGAYLALGLTCWFAGLVAFFRPRSAILYVIVFTGTAAAVNHLGRTAAGARGAGDITVLWGIWAILLVWSLPITILAGLVGWSKERFERRLRKVRGEE